MHQISDDILADWQDITTLVADFCRVPACLVTRGNPNNLEVLALSAEDDHLNVGMTMPRDDSIYCNRVINTNQPLAVVDARADATWRDCPAVEGGLTSYYGVPVTWPSGEPFGTFCILDCGPRSMTDLERRLIEKFAHVISGHLRLIDANTRLEHEASHDPLTGILNRRMFAELAEKLLDLSARSKQKTALVVFDIDHFKRVNDELGHAAGDLVLKIATETVGKQLRQSDIFARIGGEEFVVLTQLSDHVGALNVAERLRAAVEASVDLREAVGRPVTISCGVAEVSRGQDLTALLEQADQAMYRAKRNGRNRCEVAHTQAIQIGV